MLHVPWPYRESSNKSTILPSYKLDSIAKFGVGLININLLYQIYVLTKGEG